LQLNDSEDEVIPHLLSLFLEDTVKNKLFILLFVSLTLIITGCNRNANNDPIVLTINYPSYDLFYTKIGYSFEQKYPHIKIQVIEQRLDQPISLTSDIIFMNSLKKYNEIVEQNLLAPLSAHIRADKKSFQSISKIVTTALTLNSGEIYGLAPTFNSDGLYFNIDLFQRYNVPLPRNQMTWSEFYELANQFPNEQPDGRRLYGFTSNYYKEVPINLILKMGETEGLSYIDPDSNNLSINTPEWIEIGKTVLNAIERKSVFNESEEALGENGEGPIITGQAAMQIASYATAINFDLYNAQYPTEPAPQWGVVTVPVNPLTPEYSNSYRFDEIYGINKLTQNKEAAWTFIKYILTDPDYYKNNLNVFWQYGIPANELHRENVSDIDLSPLYTLLPQQQSYNPYELVNHEVINSFKTEAQLIIDEYLNGLLTIEECFMKIEKNGQLVVDVIQTKLSTQ